MPSWKKVITSGSDAHLKTINTDGNISGSSVSTGSFGKLLGDASDLTNLPASFTVANSSNNRVITSVDSSNGNAESNLTWNGSVLAVGTSSPALNQGLHVKTTYINGVARFESGDAGVSITLADNSSPFNLSYDGSSDEFNFNNASSVRYLTISSTKVSGSASSTGSFGKIEATTLKGTLETAAQENVTSLGTLTSLTVDDITLNGSTISDSGDLTLDIGGDLNIDVDGTDIILKDGGTAFGRFKRDSSDFIIKSEANNQDIILRGQDAGSTIDALLLDMSEAGSALFNSDISGSTIRASGDIIAFNSSDKRLKDNVEPIKFPLDKLGKIGGYTFDWNDKQQIYHGHDVGVLAQEIEEVLPEAVKDRGSGYKGVQYDKIIPLLIEGIKELKEKVKHIEENCDCLKK